MIAAPYYAVVCAVFVSLWAVACAKKMWEKAFWALGSASILFLPVPWASWVSLGYFLCFLPRIVGAFLLIWVIALFVGVGCAFGKLPLGHVFWVVMLGAYCLPREQHAWSAVFVSWYAVCLLNFLPYACQFMYVPQMMWLQGILTVWAMCCPLWTLRYAAISQACVLGQLLPCSGGVKGGWVCWLMSVLLIPFAQGLSFHSAQMRKAIKISSMVSLWIAAGGVFIPLLCKSDVSHFDRLHQLIMLAGCGMVHGRLLCRWSYEQPETQVRFSKMFFLLLAMVLLYGGFTLSSLWLLQKVKLGQGLGFGLFYSAAVMGGYMLKVRPLSFSWWRAIKSGDNFVEKLLTTVQSKIVRYRQHDYVGGVLLVLLLIGVLCGWRSYVCVG